MRSNNRLDGAKKTFIRGCEYFSLVPDFVEQVLSSKPPPEWAAAFGGGQRGGRAASYLAISMARRCYAERNYIEGERLALAAAQKVVTDELPSYRDAWVTVLSGIDDQLADAAGPERTEFAKRLHDLALAAIDDLQFRYARAEAPSHHQMDASDSVVGFLLKAENTLGIAVSPLAADLERRLNNRAIRKHIGAAQPFFDKHSKEIIKLWHTQREAWFRKRYEEKFKKPAPEEFMEKMPKNSHSTAAWRIKPYISRLFEPCDYEDFHVDMEALYRQQAGLPAKGEGWVSQTYLAKCVKEVLVGYEVILEATPKWLGRQRLDIFVPALNLAIEYQGEQHYFALEHWGGEQGLRDREIIDKAKRDACQQAGVRLIEWNYKTPISIQSVQAAIEEAS